MSSKTIIYTGMLIGTTLGSFVPMIWDSSPFSFSSVIFSALGGIAGIVVGYKMTV